MCRYSVVTYRDTYTLYVIFYAPESAGNDPRIYIIENHNFDTNHMISSKNVEFNTTTTTTVAIYSL